RTEAEFVHCVLGSVPELPHYYTRMKKFNSDGPPRVGAAPRLKTLPPEVFEKAWKECGAIVIDLRTPEAFGGTHIPGSYNIGAGPSLSTWVAWVLPPDRPILLVGDEQTDLDRAHRSLLRVGMDRVAGSLQEESDPGLKRVMTKVIFLNHRSAN